MLIYAMKIKSYDFVCTWMSPDRPAGHSTMTHSHRPVLRSKLSTKSSLLSMFSLLWNHEMCGIGNPVTTALRISSSPSVALVSFSGCVNLGGVVFTSCEAKRKGIWFECVETWILVFLLVCSHCPKPRPIQKQIKNRLCRIVWRCTETDINRDSYRVPTH